MEIEHGGSFSRHTHPRAYLVEISMFAAQVSSKIQIGNNLKQKEIKQTCNIEARAEIRQQGSNKDKGYHKTGCKNSFDGLLIYIQ